MALASASCFILRSIVPRRDEGFFRRDRWKHGEAHGLVGAKCGGKGVLPDTVAARDDYREDRTAEASRKVEGSRLKCDFDPEDRTLGE